MFGRSRWVGGGAHKNSRLLQFTFSWEWLRSNNPCLNKAGENCQHVALPKSEMFVKVLFFFFHGGCNTKLKRDWRYDLTRTAFLAYALYFSYEFQEDVVIRQLYIQFLVLEYVYLLYHHCRFFVPYMYICIIKQLQKAAACKNKTPINKRKINNHITFLNVGENWSTVNARSLNWR